MSFALTTAQIRDQTKTVTRRTGWQTLKPGTLLQPVVKGQGLKKGERVTPVGGPIRVVSVRRETLALLAARYRTPENYARTEVNLEGFPELTPRQFVEMFCRSHGCDATADVTRIEFEYMEPRP